MRGDVLRSTKQRANQIRDAELSKKLEGYESAAQSSLEAARGQVMKELQAAQLRAEGLHNALEAKHKEVARLVDESRAEMVAEKAKAQAALEELEGKLKTRSGLISQVVVHGNRRNFCSALITLDPDALDQWCDDHDLSGTPMRELVSNDTLRAEVQAAVDDLNGDLASYETIKKFILLQEDFTIEGGELTPSMKVKRKAVEQKYADALDGLYSGALEQV